MLYLVLGAAIASPLLGAQSSSPGGLRIVVVEGEGSINIIQQKTAVAPVVEVRDRNDQPVAGAVVRFAISRGRATFNGARVLTVTTNAAGRAAATGLTPTGSGALQIGAAATFQGQTAAVTIAQTNVMTAAASGAAAGGGGAGGSAGGGAGGGGGGTAGAGGGAAGGGGGLSTTTIGIVGGAVAGGAIAAKEVLAGDDVVLYRGSYSGTVNHVFAPSQSFCTRTISHQGTVEVEMIVNPDGKVSGEGRSNGTLVMSSFTGGQICAITTATMMGGEFGPMTGTKDAMAWHGEHPGLLGTYATFDFSGALNGDTIVGTLTILLVSTDPRDFDLGVFPVTLQKQ